MTESELTTLLAERVMGWTVTPDRYLTGDRGWIPRWRFQPAERLSDAMQLLTGATVRIPGKLNAVPGPS